MSEVQRVPEKISGVKDGVQLSAKCAHTDYLPKMNQKLLDCTIMASWENGILSINFDNDGKHQSIGVLLGELLEVLKEANAARIDAATEKKQK